MSFRLANIDDRAALIVGESYYDTATISEQRIGPDLMEVIANVAPYTTSLVGCMTSKRPDQSLALAALGLRCHDHGILSRLGSTTNRTLMRPLQFAVKPPHFDLAKSRDTYGPIGPVLVSPDLLADRDNMAITCDVNGERRQTGTTANLIFNVPALIASVTSSSPEHRKVLAPSRESSSFRATSSPPPSTASAPSPTSADDRADRSRWPATTRLRISSSIKCI